MSTLQYREDELRYLKRQNLEQEAKIVGNYYRDIIRAYGIDCTYRKLDTSVFEDYKGNVDKNTILKHAYGYNISPDYSCSAKMIAFPEIEQDIFQTAKFGTLPNADVNFMFDSTDFACALAEKCGQYKEFKIEETTVDIEVPDMTDKIQIATGLNGEFLTSSYVSADCFPYKLGLGFNETFRCGTMTGKISAELESYEYDKTQTILCDPYEHTDFVKLFPANSDLYKSLDYCMNNSEYLQILVYLTYKISKIKVGKSKEGEDIFKSLLHGKIHGGVLFYDLNRVGKYLDKIHPEVGDIVTIDFPDKDNAESYEITDCYDKSLQSDGISPLLHKYIWKCKARRYISNDDVEMNEADERLEEKKEFESIIIEDVAKKTAIYDDKQDSAYGGYEKEDAKYDTEEVDGNDFTEVDFLDSGTALDIIRFDCGSRLATTGYELVFVSLNGDSTQVTTLDDEIVLKDVVFQKDLKYLKASDQCLVFTNIEGKTYKLAEDEEASNDELQMCLTSLFDETADKSNINSNYRNFYLFKNTKTFLWATETSLYCKLASNGKLYKLA